jgi:pyruvate kinase
MDEEHEQPRLAALAVSLSEILEEAVRLEGESVELVEKVPATHRPSAVNLLHYLALRRHDLRAVQWELHTLGLSSLGRSEAYVLHSLEAVLAVIRRLQGLPPGATPRSPTRPDFVAGRRLLKDHTAELLGPVPSDRRVRIMVTMPIEAAEHYDLVRELIRRGMDVMRINCASDGPGLWLQMIENVRRAEKEFAKSCRVLCDLSGPNPRTGPMQFGPEFISLRVGDELLITAATERGRQAIVDESQRIVRPAQIGCSLNEVFQHARAGHRIFFDDGRLAGVIQGVTSEGLPVEIVRARKGEAKLRSGKSINLPDTDLALGAVTEKDLADLDFAVAHADMVGLSFVRHAADVEQFLAELDKRTKRRLGIVLKVETRQAFEELPRLLMTAMCRPPVGVMVARGDMGVELGFERLAEVQEEILWICEAAHVPVIWATQVLESLAKKGLPSRAEITDAAMGGRAECVMLNKGPHMLRTVEFLSNVLSRMQEHQEKKLSMLRRLHISEFE